MERDIPARPDPDASDRDRDLDLDAGGVRAFLIADVRGYTRFTQDRGDEAAAALAGEYASIVREVVSAAGGNLLELRGDEALAVFASPRQALRASVALRDRLIDETVANPKRPLGVGMGLDAGEAVPVEGGYRGGALNVAARLCSAAGPGEILASREFVHLARKIEGVRYTDLGRLQLKGLARSIGAVRINVESDDPARQEAFAAALRGLAPPRSRRSRLLAALGACLVLTASAVGVLITRDSRDQLASRPNTLGAIDLSSGEVTRFVDVGAKPVSVASGAGSLWVTNEEGSTVSRIDPSDGSVVQTIQVAGRPVAIAFWSGAVWVSIPDVGTVIRINPATNTVVQTLEAGLDPVDLALTDADVWLVNRGEGTVTRLDRTSGRRIATIGVGSRPAGIAVGDDVWVANTGDGTVTRIDSASNQVVKEVAVGNGPTDIAVGEGSVWVANSLDGTVSRLDPKTGVVAATIPVGSGPKGIAFGDGSVWISNEFGGSVSQIDPSSNSVVEEILVGNAPQGVTAVGDTLWFATRALPQGHRGGTLTIAGLSPLVDSIDPAIAYSSFAWQLLTVTNDGLIGFKKVGGADGATVIPDLAVSIPAPTDGGRAYTFELRPDIEYSNGKEVVATDVRATFERLFRVNSPGGYLYQGIVGARSCSQTKCNLSRGIVADDSSRTITFRLSSPDPEFIYKLALPLAYVLPADSPAKEATTRALPATGPYMIEGYEPRKGFELVRNPHFVEWSPAAQPDGYVDEIVLASGGQKDAAGAVEKSEADLVTGLTIPARILQRLLRDYTERVHVTPSSSTFGMMMNTRLPPFDNVKVRRALSLAVDRDHIVDLFGGPNQARASCQILPPNIPGYRPYCPYTINPHSGRWSAPDTARARALIKASGSHGSRVVVWDTPILGGMGKYFVSLLRDLGFEADLKFVANGGRYFEKVSDSRTRAQIFGFGWIADYPGASNFLNTLFSCDSFVPNSPRNNLNPSGLCEPSVDRKLTRALHLNFVNPPAAHRLWARIDREIVDLAPWVVAVNPYSIDFVSERVGNYEHNPQWGVLISQLWVK